jgi:hypothetical protein
LWTTVDDDGPHKEDSHKKRKKPWKEDTEGKRVKKQQQFSGAPAAVTTPPVVTQTQEEQDNVPDSTVAAIAMPMLESPHADNTAIADMAAGVINNKPRADGFEWADMDFALERLIDLEKYWKDPPWWTGTSAQPLGLHKSRQERRSVGTVWIKEDLDRSAPAARNKNSLESVKQRFIALLSKPKYRSGVKMIQPNVSWVELSLDEVKQLVQTLVYNYDIEEGSTNDNGEISFVAAQRVSTMCDFKWWDSLSKDFHFRTIKFEDGVTLGPHEMCHQTA